MAGIDIQFEENSSLNFTIETSLEGNVSWELIEYSRGDMVEEYQAQAIPVVLVIDHEGFIVARFGRNLISANRSSAVRPTNSFYKYPRNSGN